MIRAVIFTVLISFYSNVFVTSVSQYPISLVVCYDGFRYNYYDKGVTPFLKSLRNNGTYAEYMDNVFITETYPNHQSIATGTYPETHGVLGNTFYDPLYGELYGSYELFHYTDDVIPIWIINEIKGEGRHSGVMMWPGGQYNYTGVDPTYKRKQDNNVKFEDRIDEVVSWILDPQKPANLVFLYLEEPDGKGHAYGPESDETTQQLSIMDSATKYLINKLAENNLTDLVNVFFLADHGMETVTMKNIVDLREYASEDLYDRYEETPTAHIWPKEGHEMEVYNALKAASDDGVPFKVYLKSEIPERWHYSNNRRAPPILAVADPGYVFQDFEGLIANPGRSLKVKVYADQTYGVHGYDNNVKNMKPHFVALGPLIKENYQIEPFENIDLFSLWAHIAGFPEYTLNTNSTFERVSKMLKS